MYTCKYAHEWALSILSLPMNGYNGLLFLQLCIYPTTSNEFNNQILGNNLIIRGLRIYISDQIIE